jgi:glycolate oxidase iron-sulfur subunit
MAAKIGRIGLIRRLTPKFLKPMLELIPEQIPPAQSWAEVNPAIGESVREWPCSRVVRSRCSIRTSTRPRSRCLRTTASKSSFRACRAAAVVWLGTRVISQQAQRFARQNLDAFPDDVDAVLTNAAGCGSAMHEYHLVLRGTADEARAEAFRHRVMDVSVFLTKLGLREPLRKRNSRPPTTTPVISRTRRTCAGSRAIC